MIYYQPYDNIPLPKPHSDAMPATLYRDKNRSTSLAIFNYIAMHFHPPYTYVYYTIYNYCRKKIAQKTIFSNIVSIPFYRYSIKQE